MADWDEVRRLALAMPESTEPTPRDWRVRGKGFLWERPLRRGDLDALGADAPDGPILAARTADEGVKWALIESSPAVFFTTPHFRGYAAILIRLERIAGPELAEIVADAWLTRAPKRLATAYLSAHGP